jgi:LacI family transcriptional regulator
MPVTLKDVAQEAGVNLSTASRSLNGSYGVHERTRQRVLETARRLQYRPNRVARGLATGRSHTFGLVVSDIRNPYFAEVARGAEDAAFRAGWEVVLCNSDLDAEKQMRYLRSLAEKRVDGVLMNSVLSLSRTQQEELARLRVPVVLLNRPSDPQTFSTVCADNFEGGRLAGEYLVRLGHRAPAHLTGPRRHGNLADRARGFLHAVSGGVVIHGDHTSSGGYAMATRLFRERPATTAIFAGNDVLAFGAIRAARELGLRVPEDISILGFDDVELAALVDPPLTTVHQPKYEMGEAGIEILLKMAGKDNRHPPEHRVLGVRLVERQSCREWRAP